MSSTSAELIAGNDDLLAEIIGRTPLKSLIRFKCVSKHWSSLVSARHFAILHTLRHPNTKPSGLLLRHKASPSPAAATGTEADSDFQLVPLDTTSVSGSDPPPLRSFSFISGHPSGLGLKILQSCNGLLLCCSFPFTLESRRLYYVVNPTTNQYAELYSPPEDGASTTFLGVNLAFDPSKSHHYKVVCMQITLRSLYNYRIWIYSSETRRWRISSDSFTSPFDMVFTEGVFWNGSIHWINSSGASLRFDVDQESFGKMPEIPFLQSESRRRRSRYFGASNGHLHLIEVEGQQKTQFQVFEMKGDYSQWFVKYNVNLADAVAAFPEMVRSYLDPNDGCYYSFSIIGVVHDENEDESSLVLSIPGKIISYKFKDNTMKELLHCVAEKTDKRCLLQYGCPDIYQYIETLVPVW